MPLPTTRAVPTSPRPTAAPFFKSPHSVSSLPSLDSSCDSQAFSAADQDRSSGLAASASPAPLPSFLSDECASETRSSHPLLPVPAVTSLPSQKHAAPFLGEAASGLASRVFSGLLAASSSIVNTQTLSHHAPSPPASSSFCSPSNSSSASSFSSSERGEKKPPASVFSRAAAWLPQSVGGRSRSDRGQAGDRLSVDLEAGRAEDAKPGHESGARTARWRRQEEQTEEWREEGQPGKTGGADPRRANEEDRAQTAGAADVSSPGSRVPELAFPQQSQHKGERRRETDRSICGPVDPSRRTHASPIGCLFSRRRPPSADDEIFQSPRDPCDSSSSLCTLMSSSSSSFSSLSSSYASASFSSSRTGFSPVEATKKMKRKPPLSPLENDLLVTSDGNRRSARQGNDQSPTEERARRRRDPESGDARSVVHAQGTTDAFSQKQETRRHGTRHPQGPREDGDRHGEGRQRRNAQDEGETMNSWDPPRRLHRSQSFQESRLGLFVNPAEPTRRTNNGPLADMHHPQEMHRQAESETLILRQERRHLIWLENRRQQDRQEEGLFSFRALRGRPGFACEGSRETANRCGVFGPYQTQENSERSFAHRDPSAVPTDFCFSSFPEQKEAYLAFSASSAQSSGRSGTVPVAAAREEPSEKGNEESQKLRDGRCMRDCPNDQEGPREEVGGAGSARTESVNRRDARNPTLPRDHGLGRGTREEAARRRLGRSDSPGWQPNDSDHEGEELRRETSEDRKRRRVAEGETSQSEREASSSRIRPLPAQPTQKDRNHDRERAGVRMQAALKRQYLPPLPSVSQSAFPSSSLRDSSQRLVSAPRTKRRDAALSDHMRGRDLKTSGGEKRRTTRTSVPCESEGKRGPERETDVRGEPFLPRVALLGATRGRERRAKIEEERNEKREKTPRQSRIGKAFSHVFHPPQEKMEIGKRAGKPGRCPCPATLASASRQAPLAVPSRAPSRWRNPAPPSLSVAALQRSASRTREVRVSPSCPAPFSRPSSLVPSPNSSSPSVVAVSSCPPTPAFRGVARRSQFPSAAPSPSAFGSAGAPEELRASERTRSPHTFPFADIPGENGFPAYPLGEANAAIGWPGAGREEAAQTYQESFSFFSHAKRSADTFTPTDVLSSPRFGSRKQEPGRAEVAGEGAKTALASDTETRRHTAFCGLKGVTGGRRKESDPATKVGESEPAELQINGRSTECWFSPRSREREDVAGVDARLSGCYKSQRGAEAEERRSGKEATRQEVERVGDGTGEKRETEDRKDARHKNRRASLPEEPPHFGGWGSSGLRRRDGGAADAGKHKGDNEAGRVPLRPCQQSAERRTSQRPSKSQTVPLAPRPGCCGREPHPTLRMPLPISDLVSERKEILGLYPPTLDRDSAARESSESVDVLPRGGQLSFANPSAQKKQMGKEEDSRRQVVMAHKSGNGRTEGQITARKTESRPSSQTDSGLSVSVRTRWLGSAAEHTRDGDENEAARGKLREANWETVHRRNSGESAAGECNRETSQPCLRKGENEAHRKRLRSLSVRVAHEPQKPPSEKTEREGESSCPSSVRNASVPSTSAFPFASSSSACSPSSSVPSSVALLSPNMPRGPGTSRAGARGRRGEAAGRSIEGRRDVREKGMKSYEDGKDGDGGRAASFHANRSQSRDEQARSRLTRPPVPPRRISQSVGREERTRGDILTRQREDAEQGIRKTRSLSFQSRQSATKTYLKKRSSETASCTPSHAPSPSSFHSSHPSTFISSSSFSSACASASVPPASSCSALPPVQKHRIQVLQKAGLPPAPRSSNSVPCPSSTSSHRPSAGCRARRPLAAVVQTVAASSCSKNASLTSSQRPSFSHNVSYLEWLSQSGFEVGSSSPAWTGDEEKQNTGEKRQAGGASGGSGDADGREGTGDGDASSALQRQATDREKAKSAERAADEGDAGQRKTSRGDELAEKRDGAGGVGPQMAAPVHGAEDRKGLGFEEDPRDRTRTGTKETTPAIRTEPRIEDFCADGDLPIGCGRTGTVHRARCIGGPLLEDLLRFHSRTRRHVASRSFAQGQEKAREERERTDEDAGGGARTKREDRREEGTSRGGGEREHGRENAREEETARRTEKEEGFSENDTVAAVKVLSKANIAQMRIREQVKKERDIHLGLEHPNIVRFFSSFEDDQQLYFVLEYANGGTLRDRLKRCHHIQETEAAHLIFQLADALCYLHGKGIIHRDLKPENLLLHFDVEETQSLDSCGPDVETGSQRATVCGHMASRLTAVRPSSLYRFGQLKIADFGFACYCPSPHSGDASDIDTRTSSSSPSTPSPSSSKLLSATHKRTTFCGTATYLAPEIVRKEPYDMRIDLWCLGVCLYELLMGQPPFLGDSKEALFNQICELTDLPFHPTISHEARSLILRLCSKQADERPSAADVLTDPWIVRFLGVNDIEKGCRLAKNELSKKRLPSRSLHQDCSSLSHLSSHTHLPAFERE
ncbi:aurora kinase(incomplete catalytic triad) [Toxoplasma gondii ME49]|uniref:Aurora kinase(Incomplete catalytic triad) n=5 Tax=Toxoplasma gondii TaxID=5811 RepID=S7VT75_TOXGG|nr:aurora kinase(incomplete catalytic triad) [Toxoplasma gondii ME49]EPR58209.1 aurora kinase(incomplete catalytic triad) [Toxoplasma gondii GT1]EPT31488.1 aurora kinase(incomplete catalytic triad) [Toxoplasma gondii ME49]KAF4644961.1 aurora kinase(incomplete catalytic triad) [Toxoplasma gondii]|eukprot:XP_018638015.1 aurora kinase(incomplete catalytic triad) [Toxoplasma gondii ME49]